jgi:ABC-2 type transport system ATP-binding protein
MEIIETNNLVKRYGDGYLALNGLNIELNKKTTIILGRNGAGKTTLLRILSTQLMPTSGKAKVLGYDVVNQARQIRDLIVSIPQEAEAIGIVTPYEQLLMYLTAREIPRDRIDSLIEKTLRLLGLYDFRDKPSDFLSGGMKRKIFVAMALASNARLTFLDEPTVGLDPISRMEVWSAIKKLKGNVVLTTHYMEEAKVLGNEIVLIDSGRVTMQGSLNSLLKPMRGLMRVEGVATGKMRFRIGGTDISYLHNKEALHYANKGFDIKPLDLEDLFILKEIK